jgi:lipopolysaccharide transport system ATP-binding protein
MLVTHDIAAIQSLCDRCIWLSEGKLQSDGPPKEVTDLYLAHIFEQTGSQQKLGAKQSGSSDSTSWDEKQEEELKYEYARNAFSFNPNAASLGDGGAVVKQVEFTERKSDRQINSVSGGEEVSLIIQVRVARSIIHPVIGFIFRNRLGQDLFSENTYCTRNNAPEPVTKGDTLTATFWFCMPILPSGEYSLTVAVAEANDKQFDIHHWIHDAIFIKSVSSSWSTGLVGIPMNKVELKKQ